MKEIWKDIPNYEGLYQVSNLGNVKSVKNKKKMSLIDHGNEYLYVTFSKDGKRKNFYVHRLVSQAFIKDYDESKVTNHKDYNRKNNRVDNLECVSQKDNIRYSLKNRKKFLTFKTNTGEHHISKRGNIYRVTISKKEYSGCKTLIDAIKLRDKLINERIGDYEKN